MKQTLEDIKTRLTEMKRHNAFSSLDVGDLGNEIGIVVGTLTRDDIRDFINGLEHGISLSNGTHDDLGSNDFIHISIRTGK